MQLAPADDLRTVLLVVVSRDFSDHLSVMFEDVRVKDEVKFLDGDGHCSHGRNRSLIRELQRLRSQFAILLHDLRASFWRSSIRPK